MESGNAYWSKRIDFERVHDSRSAALMQLFVNQSNLEAGRRAGVKPFHCDMRRHAPSVSHVHCACYSVLLNGFEQFVETGVQGIPLARPNRNNYFRKKDILNKKYNNILAHVSATCNCIRFWFDRPALNWNDRVTFTKLFWKGHSHTFLAVSWEFHPPIITVLNELPFM